MKLTRLTERVWYTDFEPERDRPVLGYIRGDRYSVAVDAGHSDAHVAEFYEALSKEGLPLPTLTVITHWHWDHSFGMHAVNGATVANRRTDEYLRQAADRIEREGTDWFFALDESIPLEYEGGRPVRVVPADCVFQREHGMDPGNVPTVLFQAVSPHTDDCTLIWVPREKVLFMGDAVSGEFPSWRVDPDKMKKLIQTVEMTDAEHFVTGHWQVRSREEILADMRDSME